MNELFQAYQNYIWFTFLVVAAIILTAIERFRTAIFDIWTLLLALAKFIGDAFTESGGKTSFSRIAGFYVIIRITTAGGPIPEEWMTLFMFLIGYQLISGLLRDNPAIFELLKMRYGVKDVKPSEPGA